MSASTSQPTGWMKKTGVALLSAAALAAAAWAGGLDIAAAHDGLQAVWRSIVALVTWNRAITVGVAALTVLAFLALAIRQSKRGG